MPVFISPDGNPEVWAACPNGYMTPEQWLAAHPAPEPPAPTLEEAKAAKLAEIETAYEAALASAVAFSHPQAAIVAVEAALLAAGDPQGLEFVHERLAAQRAALAAEVRDAAGRAAVRAVVPCFTV